MEILRYKGFEAEIKYSDEDESYIGEVIGRHDILVFDGKTKNELETSFHLVVENYLDYCLKNAKPSNRPEEKIGIKEKRQKRSPNEETLKTFKDGNDCETAYLMSSPKNAQRLNSSIASIKEGKVFERDLIEQDD